MERKIMKQKILAKTLCGALVLGAIAPAFAANDITITRPNRASANMASNMYFGAHLANAQYKEADDSSAAFSLFGGYHLNEVLAIDLAYSDFGEAEKSGDKTEATAFSLGILGKVPVRTGLIFFGKLGLASWDADVSTGSLSDSDSGTDVYFGIGVDYDISGTSAVRFGLDRYTLSGSDNSDEDITSFSIGIIFKP